MEIDKGKIVGVLKTIMYPGTNRDIFSMYMVENLIVEGEVINLSLAIPSPNYEHKGTLNFSCIEGIQKLYPKATINVHMVARPENFPKTPSSSKAPLPIKNIIAVASGKGGVGKSTVSSNLALSLKRLGYKVGLADMDLYGPSIPTIFGIHGERPKITEVNGRAKIVPLVTHGMQIMSMGFVAGPEQAVVMRGPRLAAIVKQFLIDTLWSDLDFLIIDLPPGTGDIQLSLVQTVPVTAAIIVTTPQKVAVADAIKAANMFKVPSVNVPILGIVENMSWFIPEEFPDHKYLLFGKGGGEALAKEMDTQVIGQVPIVQSIQEGGDNGQPVALNEGSITAEYFMDIARKTVEQTNLRNERLAPTMRVEMEEE